MNGDTDAMGRLIFEALRTAAALEAAGAALVAPLGLTPARWQVLATLVWLDRPETVAGLARRLSLARQSVQRVVNDMVEAGQVEMTENPADRRAKLAVPTETGRALAAKAETLRQPWTAGLAEGLDAATSAEAAARLAALRRRLG